ncbi:proton-conducting transporter transmembrane domain-containing protein [Legionella quinlivanii]|uniref:proton-conducting transporter transmembrane domain-containing protein n=1 Tax=Legionella quinlivanii TaxID=45073 RepID=UPI002243AD62|nr:proton-conducting transporter membrane subunit [Legionella quinlivanii]MCW8450315.1 proton-conducting transporter membrane subunit [Legionella quinlivanii]
MNTIVLFFLCLMLASPIIALALNCLISRPIVAARLAGYSIGSGFLTGIGLLSYLSLSQNSAVYLLISFNTLSLLLCSLILLVSFIVHRFSLRYMHGDRLYKRFFLLLSALTFTALIMVLADDLFLFWCALSASNVFLVLLMVHKSEWTAAKNSARLAFYTLASGCLSLLIAFIILTVTYRSSSISLLVQITQFSHPSLFSISMGLILIGAVVQSGLLPFHRWLISSLNSPTPVSALMHAGLVNGGGILIVKLASLMILCPGLLTLLFIVGSISALLGTTWKLMQHDVKKMLACSTMAQMGFMMMQCGVGLFAAAIAHLCWHGLFKAYLFLSSGSAVKQRKSETNSSNKGSLIMLMISLSGGIAAMVSFAFATNKSLSVHEASSFVLFFTFIAGSQLMFTWIRTRQTMSSFVLALLLAMISGLMYGASIQLIQWLIPGISMLKTSQLSIIHWAIMASFAALWAFFNLGMHQTIGQSRLGCWLYMNLFNSSQPSLKTVTALRNDYNY